MLNLLPLTGFLCAAVCLYSIQFSKGEVPLKEKDILQQWNKEKKNNRVCLKYFSSTIKQMCFSKYVEPTDFRSRSGVYDNITRSRKKKAKLNLSGLGCGLVVSSCESCNDVRLQQNSKNFCITRLTLSFLWKTFPWNSLLVTTKTTMNLTNKQYVKL
jgi:hypothetical protein